ncbi:hypothetical protein P8452_27929 [Trifolium repens]|nr:hypothetical protein P8452_27929 [Trifolium repens]
MLKMKLKMSYHHHHNHDEEIQEQHGEPPLVAPPAVLEFGGGPYDLSMLPTFGKHVEDEVEDVIPPPPIPRRRNPRTTRGTTPLVAPPAVLAFGGGP